MAVAESTREIEAESRVRDHCGEGFAYKESGPQGQIGMTYADTTTEGFANTRLSVADDLPEHAPIPRASEFEKGT